MKTRFIEYSIVCLVTSLCWSIAYAKKPIERKLEVIEVTKVEEHKIDREMLVRAFIQVESEGNPRAVNKKTKATGVLQLMPIMVKQANEIVGHNKYKLSDRWSEKKSIEIFHVVMGKMNPTYDIHLCCKIWHPRSKLDYHRKVVNKYNELIKENRL